jgi:type VI secretion system protein ImpJ
VHRLSKIVWSEGMQLGPHHFQAQAAYFEDALQFATASLWFESYGMVGYELDTEALRNGTVSLVHARGIFPDGLIFHMPDEDPLPEPRNIVDLFPPARDRMNLSLAVPSKRPGGANCALTDAVSADGVRYVAQEELLRDDNTGLDEKPVRVGRKNIRLLLDVEPSEGYVTLPLARVMRDGAGGFIYDETFIPPCLRISTSERLMTMTRRLVDILQEKSTALSAAARGQGRRHSGLSAQQVATFWFLHSINSALAPLRHLCFSKHGHPVELFTELLRLGGALCTFGLESHPRDLPLYNHLRLEGCFEALDDHIRRHLELLVPSNCIAIELQSVSNYFYEADITDERCFGRSRWIFAIQAEMGEAELITQTPKLAKICSSKFVPELVRRALPGMKLTHLPSPPSAVSPTVLNQYFAVDKGGPCWEHLLQTKRVGVYVPGEFPRPQLELLVVLEG